MRSVNTTLAWIALTSFTWMVGNVSASPSFALPLWHYQWALDNSDATQGICLSVPDTNGSCQRSAELPVADIDINADTAWLPTMLHPAAATELPQEVIIGLIDSGIDYLHPDLKNHLWQNPGEVLGLDANNNGVDDGCEDSIDGDGNGYLNDCHGINTLVESVKADGSLNPDAGDPMDSALAHGTHMAGLMIGDGGDGNGVRGVAGASAQVKIATCKSAQMEEVLELIPGVALPALTQSSMKRCVDYFTALKERGENVVVINASGGMSAFINLFVMYAKVKEEFLLDGADLRPALDRLGELGVVVVAAAGNFSWDMDANFSERAYFPAAYDANNVISVAAIDAQGKLWSGSSYGRYSVDVAAPGHKILSTLPREAVTGPNAAHDYGIASGTSPATALVSGMVALIKSSPATADLSAAEVRRLVLSSGQPLAALSDNTLSGRLVRLSDANGQGALSCANQQVQRRIQPQAAQLTLLPGDTLHLEVESFTCEQVTTGSLTLQSDNGIELQLVDNGEGADRVSGDGIFTADWTIPESAQPSYTFTLSQGAQMAAEKLIISTTVIADNGDASCDASGLWWPTKLRTGYYGNGYIIAYASSTERTFDWFPVLPRAGHYELQIRWPSSVNFASNALLRFSPADVAETSVRLDQHQNGGQWVSVGEYDFTAGKQRISLSNAGADSTIAADAVQLIWKGNQ